MWAYADNAKQMHVCVCVCVSLCAQKAARRALQTAQDHNDALNTQLTQLTQGNDTQQRIVTLTQMSQQAQLRAQQIQVGVDTHSKGFGVYTSTLECFLPIPHEWELTVFNSCGVWCVACAHRLRKRARSKNSPRRRSRSSRPDKKSRTLGKKALHVNEPCAEEVAAT